MRCAWSNRARGVHGGGPQEARDDAGGAPGGAGARRRHAIGRCTGRRPDGLDDAGASNVVWIESAASAAFVDREEELGVLREAWSSAKAGRRVLALVAGEPGIGKTALTAELARLVSAGRGPGAVRPLG